MSPRLFLSGACSVPLACQTALLFSKFGAQLGSPWLLQLFPECQGGLRGSPALLSDWRAGLGERGLRLPLSSSQLELVGRGGSPWFLLALPGCRAGLGERRGSLGPLLCCSRCQETRWP